MFLKHFICQLKIVTNQISRLEQGNKGMEQRERVNAEPEKCINLMRPF